MCEFTDIFPPTNEENHTPNHPATRSLRSPDDTESLGTTLASLAKQHRTTRQHARFARQTTQNRSAQRSLRSPNNTELLY